MNDALFYRGQRQLLGESKHALIQSKSVLVVGLGSLGAPLSLNLSLMGIPRMGLCDFDVVEESNLQRQFLFSYADLGKSKVEVSATFLKNRNPTIKIATHEVKLDASNALALVASYDLVLDCSDDYASKILLNKVCFQQQIDYISTSVYHYDGIINVLPFSLRKDPSLRESVACLSCSGFDKLLPSDLPCSEVGMLSAVTSSLGSLQAIKAIELLVKDERIFSHSILCSFKPFSMDEIGLKVDKKCLQCKVKDAGEKQEQAVLSVKYSDIENENFIWINLEDEQEFKQDIELLQNFLFHRKKPPLIHHSLEKILLNAEAILDTEKSYLLICQQEIKSLYLSQWLQQKGYHSLSLKGGFAEMNTHLLAEN